MVIVGRFQRNRDGSYIGWVEFPGRWFGRRTVSCRLVQDEIASRMGLGEWFLELVAEEDSPSS